MSKEVSYQVEGRNGYFAVDLYESEKCLRGPLFTGTRRQAEQVAQELGAAYDLGRVGGWIDLGKGTEGKVLLCHDDRHGIACPQPCLACIEEGCDPSQIY